ncbi:MAG: O-antigen ligase family protein [Patescibacteria group bacterium]|nr:O-antigen ligase family protein [Patescibacteria group bacterium]
MREEGEKGLTFLVMAFLFTALISSFLGVDFYKSLSGNYFRGDGLLTLFHLVCLFFFVKLFWQESWKRATFFAFSTSSTLLSFWIIFLAIRYFFLGNWGDLNFWGGAVFGKAIGATFGQPNFLGGYLLISLPFSVYWLKKGGRIGLIGLISQIGGILLTGSVGGILGILVLGFFLIWRKLGKLERLGSFGVLGVLAMLIVFQYLPRWQPTAGADFFPESRERIITKGFLAFTKRPVSGWGVANFDYAFKAVDWPLKVKDDIYFDKAHGNLLEVLVTMGLIGTAIYILTIMRGLRDLRALKEKTWLIVFLLFLFHSQTNIISINEEMMFWLILGISAKGKSL